jgi:hypothetical protein
MFVMECRGRGGESWNSGGQELIDHIYTLLSAERKYSLAKFSSAAIKYKHMQKNFVLMFVAVRTF